ncbi:MAG: adenylate/guanylate cyclase domain-containing protein [bacterium]
MICTACGFANGPLMRFCGGCGTKLEAKAPAPTEAERRQLTVLMCDLVGSTALSQSLDPEDLRDLLTEYQRVCSDAVKRHDGHIAQYLGDGVLVYFGFPHAHEDDARRAIRCALDILSGMNELNAAQGKRLDSPLQVRIGVHTGRVVVGTVGSGLNQEILAQGDAPNIAARVQSIATPDTIVASDSTWKIVQGYFTGVSLGDHELKGFARPVRLWHVTTTSGAESRLEGMGALTAYVGRDQEIARLDTLWAEAQAGVARFVTLRGEAGMGKSRLLEVFRHRVEVPGVDVLELRCTPYSLNSAFFPFTELIERRLGLDRTLPATERLDRIDARLGELGISAPDAAPLVASLLSIPTDDRYGELALSPVRRRVRTLEVLVAMMKALTDRQPTVFVAEDLHWSDPSTLELLQLIMAAMPASRILGIFTARPEFEPPWSIGERTPLIDLSRLQNSEVEAIVQSVAHGKTLPGEVVREIVQRCDGVPLFVEEVARAVIEAGVLVEGEFSWELTGPLPTGLIPASVDASLMARIDKLGDARSTAQLAATIGREFSLALLAAVSERSADQLREDLDRITSSGLARQTVVGDREIFVFKHALVQVAAYESLLRTTRQRFHERIARVLRADFAAEVAHQPELVARHLSGAGNHADASDYWAAAGENALGRLAVREANSHFARALEGLKTIPETPEVLTKELDLQIAIAPTLMAVNGWASPTVAVACERARALSLQLGRPDKLYPPLWGLWTNLFVGGLLDRALVTAHEALAMAIGSGSPMLEITGRHAVAYTYYYQGEWDQAIPHVEAALPLYEVEQERVLTSMFQLSSTVNLLASLGSSLWMQGKQDRGLQEMERMISVARDLNHPSALSNALGVACYMLTFHHDFPRMLKYATEVKSFAREEGYELWYAVGVMSSGWARMRLGGRVDGLKELFEGVALFRATQSDLMGPTVGVIHGEGLWAAGRHVDALRMLRETAATAYQGHVGVLLPDVYRLMGEILMEQGELGEAEAAFRRALDTASSQKALSLELRAALSLHALLKRTKRGEEGVAMVGARYDRFTEGFGQPDLVKARAILEQGAR